MTNTVLKITNLTKKFNKKAAVHELSLNIPSGIFYGLVGPNGAGKTTTLSMIAGLLRPTQGEIFIDGESILSSRELALSNIGVMMDGLSYPERLTAYELLEYVGLLRGLDNESIKTRSDDLLETLGLDKTENTLVVDFSTGMRKKIALAMAIIHMPKLLVLDEPFEAIDPVSSQSIEQLLRQYVAAGGTVLLSSHVMSFVERLCERVAVIKDGVIIADDEVTKVAGAKSLQDKFIELVGSSPQQKKLDWLSL